ncbi:WW domain binding protein VOPP1 isoform 2-T2 [Synchiropus picturatus]
MRNPLEPVALTLCLFLETVEAKKHCWYFEGGYPIYFICRSYEDCCGTRCCVQALSIQRLWYFWVLLMMGVLFCCGAGFFIRRRMYPSPLRDEPAFNVSFTRHPVNSPGGRQEDGPCKHERTPSETSVKIDVRIVMKQQTRGRNKRACGQSSGEWWSRRVRQDVRKRGETDC